jgi:AcrR family transcriptional regulator
LEPEVRKENILRAAARAFSEKGFHATRISDIAGFAGVAQGTIYRFFESKEEIATTLLSNGTSHVEVLVQSATNEAQASGDPSRGLEIFLDLASDFYYRHRSELLALHSWSLDPSVQSLSVGIDDELAEQLRLLIERAGAKVWHARNVDLSRLVLMFLYSLSSQIEHYRASSGGGEVVAQLIKKMIYVDPPQ